jgi:phosphocarrier protein
MTIERSIKIENEHGLHLRAAAMVARTACEFMSDIKICYNSKTVDGKSTMGLMTLGAPNDGTILVQAHGDDAAPAVDAIHSLLQDDDFIFQPNA